MNNDNKSLMSPDRVLSLVTLVLSVLMILGSASLYNAQDKISRTGAIIGTISNESIGQMRVMRLQAQETEEGDEGDAADVVEE